MNKEIQVLYTIFQLELNPPFNLVISGYVLRIYNKHSEHIGWFDADKKCLTLTESEQDLISNRVKQVFNIDNLTDDDVYHIAKHLVKWFQDKFPKKVDGVGIWNDDSKQYIEYPTKK